MDYFLNVLEDRLLMALPKIMSAAWWFLLEVTFKKKTHLLDFFCFQLLMASNIPGFRTYFLIFKIYKFKIYFHPIIFCLLCQVFFYLSLSFPSPYLFLFMELVNEPRALHILSKCLIFELHSASSTSLLQGHLGLYLGAKSHETHIVRPKNL